MTRLPQRPLGRPNRFRPRVEGLEDRNLLDCTATFAGGVVTVTGTNKADTIFIDDFGNDLAAGTPQFTVLCDGVQALQVDAKTVTAVVINTKGGDDTVIYRCLFLNGTVPGSASRSVSANLGIGNDDYLSSTGFLISAVFSESVQGSSGNDTLVYSFAGAGGTSSTSINMMGGAGQDRIIADALIGNSFGHLIDAASTVAFNLNGGSGDDLLSTQALVELDGEFTVVEDGGSGSDRISNHIVLAADSGVGEPVAPTLTVSKLGQKGRDRFNAFINKLSPAPITITATIDGGADKDTVTTAGNVSVMSSNV
jgi:hypothetical protein